MILLFEHVDVSIRALVALSSLCSSARLLLRLGRTMRRCLRFGLGLCVLWFGSPTFFWSYDTFMTVSRFVLGSSIRVLVFRQISFIWLD